MQIKKIVTDQHHTSPKGFRPEDFGEFVGQADLKKVLLSAISSAQLRKEALGHVLLSGPSGYGKTTLAQIIAKLLGVQIKIINAYAISKPAEMISILNSLQVHDILFVDEVHRLKAPVEEVLYSAMEDHVIDMVMPEGGSVRIPIHPFTLVGATTQMESLSTPFKNRFIYKFHLIEYDTDEKHQIILRYLHHYHITAADEIIGLIGTKVDTVPREIHNMCIQIRDYLIADGQTTDHLVLNTTNRGAFDHRLHIDAGGITELHRRYLDILTQSDGPVGLKTIALKLGIHEQSVEGDIEALLLKNNIIEKTPRGRIKKE